MKKKTSLVFATGKIASINEKELTKGVIRDLRGRECFVDADTQSPQRLYSGEVFEQILGEIDEEGKNGYPKTYLDQLEELAKKLGKFDYVIVTDIEMQIEF